MATKIGPKISSSPHRYFIEHLEGVFENPPREHDEDYENSSLLIRRLKSKTGFHLRETSHNQDLNLEAKSNRAARN
jgi:hypothetical protein